jgi:hypothetical protein
MGTMCVCHVHDGWVPLEWHHVWPVGDGGPNITANKIRVCANAHYSIHAVIDEMEKRKTVDLPWEFMKHFSPAIRQYARTGYDRIQRGAM